MCSGTCPCRLVGAVALLVGQIDLVGGYDADFADYGVSQFLNRPRRGTFLELLVLHLVSVSFPGFRLFLVLPRVPIVNVLQGVRICFLFLVLPIIGCLLRCQAPEVQFLGIPGSGRLDGDLVSSWSYDPAPSNSNCVKSPCFSLVRFPPFSICQAERVQRRLDRVPCQRKFFCRSSRVGPRPCLFIAEWRQRRTVCV